MQPQRQQGRQRVLLPLIDSQRPLRRQQLQPKRQIIELAVLEAGCLLPQQLPQAALLFQVEIAGGEFLRQRQGQARVLQARQIELDGALPARQNAEAMIRAAVYPIFEFMG